MLRWCILSNAYGFSLINCPEKSEISTFPLLEVFSQEIEKTLLYRQEISRVTLHDPVLSRACHWVLGGWPNKNQIQVGQRKNQIQSFRYFLKKDELSVHGNYLSWGNHVIIPECLEDPVCSMT